jgi:hypothetical protein
LRAAAKTSQPAAFSRRAVASPMPVDAPVTSTVFTLPTLPEGPKHPRR